MMWGYGWGWPGMLWMSLGGLFWIVVVGLVIWAVVHWLGERSTSDRQPPVGGPSALEVLEQRYARGEIDAVTFEQMRERLVGSQRGIERPQETHVPAGAQH
jgi:putative membrane protein